MSLFLNLNFQMFILRKKLYIMLIKKSLNFIKKIKEKSHYNVIVFTTQHYNL